MSNPYNLTPDQILQKLPYEHRGRSQHLEIGIIRELAKNLKINNKFFFEIGWANGGCNMTTDLFDDGWTGIGIDVYDAPHPSIKLPNSFKYRKLFVDPDNLSIAFNGVPKDFEFFSLDIDSYDFVISEWLLKNKFRPKFVCLEINPRFGPIVEASFPWKKRIKKLYNKQGIYGVSIAKYKKLWESYGYKLFTYDSSLTNVFFYHVESLNDLSQYKVHTLADFPIKVDVNRDYIIEHGRWAEDLDLIYVPYTPS